jgi:hypothetical protein
MIGDAGDLGTAGPKRDAVGAGAVEVEPVDDDVRAPASAA